MVTPRRTIDGYPAAAQWGPNAYPGLAAFWVIMAIPMLVVLVTIIGIATAAELVTVSLTPG